ncbi:hypothetical protein [Desulfovibrio inopinatus]|uniref:hypothetical protein n=1 Tax=Desulfovibrio inopinatus TaxID=102109 RepID=UPI00041966B5|nr:hypothetical protein [Desulfovibrio inopinatus]
MTDIPTPTTSPSPLDVLDTLLTQTSHSRLYDAFLAHFVDSYAKDWTFCIPETFKDALDIRYAARMIDKRRIMAWSQGSCFAFREGCIVYDTPRAYKPWAEALQHITTAFKVRKSSPAIPATNGPKKWPKEPERAAIKEYIASFGQNYVSHTAEMEKGEFVVRVQTARFRGYLEVAKLTPNEQHTALVQVDEFPISQDDFVEWLITGQDPYNKKHNEDNSHGKKQQTRRARPTPQSRFQRQTSPGSRRRRAARAVPRNHRR